MLEGLYHDHSIFLLSVAFTVPNFYHPSSFQDWLLLHHRVTPRGILSVSTLISAWRGTTWTWLRAWTQYYPYPSEVWFPIHYFTVSVVCARCYSWFSIMLTMSYYRKQSKNLQKLPQNNMILVFCKSSVLISLGGIYLYLLKSSPLWVTFCSSV